MFYADNRTAGRTTGNTAVGYESLKGSSTAANNTGQFNTAIGYQSLLSNTSGYWNTANGYNSLKYNTSGYENTAFGHNTLENNTTGYNNLALGIQSLYYNTTGFQNTAIGENALNANTTGHENLAVGPYSLFQNITGSENIAIGRGALWASQSASSNTSIGWRTMEQFTTGRQNLAIGQFAMRTYLNGIANTAIGSSALENIPGGDFNTAIGFSAGGNNGGIVVNYSTAIGTYATVTTSNTMVFGAENYTTKWAFGRPTTSYALQVGNTTADGNGAYLSTGGTWTNGSSRDFKEDFEELNDEEILNKIDNLSVTKWKYKGTNETHIGPIAEEFKEQFNLGVSNDNKHISTIDASGVALKAIQVLRKENNILKQKNLDFENKYNLQEQRIRALETLLNKLLEQKQ